MCELIKCVGNDERLGDGTNCNEGVKRGWGLYNLLSIVRLCAGNIFWRVVMHYVGMGRMRAIRVNLIKLGIL